METIGQLPGTGVGLTLVWDVLEVHGGRVGVEGESEMGDFSVPALPLAEEWCR